MEVKGGVHDKVALLRVERKPGEIHGTGDLRFDRDGDIERPVSPHCASAQSKTCLVENKTRVLSALFCMSDVYFVSGRPKLVKQTRV